ncbi:MAG TPA: hypothetical protein VGD38_20400 [Pyrinomonadaceae bacterium]
MSTTMGQGNMGANAGQGQSQTRSGEGQMMGRGGSEEGPIARTIEQQTKKLPSDTFLWAALGSIGASALLRVMGKKNASLFVGEWVAPMLLFGVYNKIVKIQGSDRNDRGH